MTINHLAKEAEQLNHEVEGLRQRQTSHTRTLSDIRADYERGKASAEVLDETERETAEISRQIDRKLAALDAVGRDMTAAQAQAQADQRAELEDRRLVLKVTARELSLELDRRLMQPDVVEKLMELYRENWALCHELYGQNMPQEHIAKLWEHPHTAVRDYATAQAHYALGGAWIDPVGKHWMDTSHPRTMAEALKL